MIECKNVGRVYKNVNIDNPALKVRMKRKLRQELPFVMREKGHFVYAYLTFGVRVVVYVSY